MIPQMLAQVLILGGLMTFAPAQEITWLDLVSAPAVSPDGKSMVFEWIGDLWTASTNGGEAMRVEQNPAREACPLFSPDGKRIVFSSDRTGSMQIFSIPATGGGATQHTHHTEGNELECLSPDGTHAMVRGTREHAGFRSTRLLSIDLTRDSREQRLFDASAESASYSPDGKRILFCRGGEQLYRKGYKGSRASQIWQYDISSKRFDPMVAEETESRSPVWQSDGKGCFFVSSKNGTSNLWVKRYDSPTPQALAHFTGDGIVLRAPSADGTTFVFQQGLGLFRFRLETDQTPIPLRLWTRAVLPDVTRETKTITGTTDADFTADAKQMIFSAAGDLWWMKNQGAEPTRLTETPTAESDVHFSPDGGWLYFLSDDGLESNYHRARFKDGQLLENQKITGGTRSKHHFKPSPDSRKIAWLEGTGDVFTANTDGSAPRCVFPCWDVPAFDWSPDSRWLAMAAEDRNANRDIHLVAADGSRPPLNVTRHPAFEGSPRWSPDGRWLIFSSRRGDAARSQLWRIDFGKNGLAPNLEDEEIAILGDKAVVISTGEIEPVRTIWAADSKSLFFQNREASDPNLYALTDGGVKTVREERGVPIRVTEDGSLLWRVNQVPAVLKDGELTRFAISIKVERSRDVMLRLAFRRIWKTLGERFYDAKMNGTDWDALRLKYETAATGARTSRQFDRVVSQLLGELNASHLTFQREPWVNEIRKKSTEKPTAHPGLIFRDGSAEGPLVIDEVLTGSPIDLLKDKPEEGEIVVKIAGEPVTNLSALHPFFNGAEKRPLAVVIRAKDGKERVLELRCISYERARTLEQKQSYVESRKLAATAGKISYQRVPDMNRDTFEKLELEIYRQSLDSDGMILDLRDNGGGREADRMLSLFCQPVHSRTVPRDGPEGYPLARRAYASWDKPLVVLCNENTFSNAEIFCHAIRATKRGPLVGKTTAGGVISAVETNIPDAGDLQVPFRGWFDAVTRKNLDLNGAVPDFPAELTPEDEDAGTDPPLRMAVERMREMLR
jgi:tricorn protease